MCLPTMNQSIEIHTMYPSIDIPINLYFVFSLCICVHSVVLNSCKLMDTSTVYFCRFNVHLTDYAPKPSNVNILCSYVCGGNCAKCPSRSRESPTTVSRKNHSWSQHSFWGNAVHRGLGPGANKLALWHGCQSLWLILNFLWFGSDLSKEDSNRPKVCSPILHLFPLLFWDSLQSQHPKWNLRHFSLAIGLLGFYGTYFMPS